MALWRIRLTHEFPRYLLYAVASVGLLASARFAIDPPRPTLQHTAPRISPQEDLGAEGYASLFARRYLTWDARDPEAQRRALAGFVGSSAEGDGGLRPPPSGSQQVLWTDVVQAREPRANEHVYTVAVQTDVAGLLYLTVSVLRTARGALALAGYPAFVGAPASSPRPAGMGDALGIDAPAQNVADHALVAVVQRTLRNYLAGAPSELVADLADSARVSLPGLKLAVRAFQGLQWLADGHSVRATVVAEAEGGAQYTLGYELDVTRQGDRWEVSAIQMDPDK